MAAPIAPHFLVTAGSTHEFIDTVRVWGNIFTGKTGLDIALALLDLGDVTLLTSNMQHADEFNGYSGKRGMLGIETYTTHSELLEILSERMTSGDHVEGVAMSAAVADYVPAGCYRILSRDARADGTETWSVQNVDAPKIKSSHGEIAIRGTATRKLVDLFRQRWAYKGVLIKFKLEVGISEEKLIAIASQSRVASGADLIVANTLEMVRGESPAAYFIDAESTQRIPRAALAGEIRLRLSAKLRSV